MEGSRSTNTALNSLQDSLFFPLEVYYEIIGYLDATRVALFSMASSHFQHRAWNAVKSIDPNFIFNSYVNMDIPGPQQVEAMLVAIASKMQKGLFQRLEHIWFTSEGSHVQEGMPWNTEWFLPMIRALLPSASRLKSLGLACIREYPQGTYDLLIELVSKLGEQLERVCLFVPRHELEMGMSSALLEAILDRPSFSRLKELRLDLVTPTVYASAKERITGFCSHIYSSPAMQVADHIGLPTFYSHSYSVADLEALAKFVQSRIDQGRPLKSIVAPLTLFPLFSGVVSSKRTLGTVAQWQTLFESRLALYFPGMSPAQVSFGTTSLLSWPIKEFRIVMPDSTASLENMRASLKGLPFQSVIQTPKLSQLVASVVPSEEDSYDLACAFTAADRLHAVSRLRINDTKLFETLIKPIVSDPKFALSILPRGPASLVYLFTSPAVDSYGLSIVILRRIMQNKQIFNALGAHPNATVAGRTLASFLSDPADIKALEVAWSNCDVHY